MDMETLIKVRERQKYLKDLKNKTKTNITDNLGTEENGKE